jgi:hypothetical protein
MQEGLVERLRHVAYVSGWKKFEPLWDWVIRAKRVGSFLPLLEMILSGEGKDLDCERDGQPASPAVG